MLILRFYQILEIDLEVQDYRMLINFFSFCEFFSYIYFLVKAPKCVTGILYFMLQDATIVPILHYPIREHDLIKILGLI